MSTWQTDVARFMTEVKTLELPTRPTIPDEWNVLELCKSLIKEEGRETTKAIDDLLQRNAVESLAQVADGICDTIYVLLYTANMLGIDIEPCWNEVQRSNMTKKGGVKRVDGKQLKGPNYEPPNLEAIIKWQLLDQYEWASQFLGKWVVIKDAWRWQVAPSGYESFVRERFDTQGQVQVVTWQGDNNLELVVMTGVDYYVNVNVDPFTTVELLNG